MLRILLKSTSNRIFTLIPTFCIYRIGFLLLCIYQIIHNCANVGFLWRNLNFQRKKFMTFKKWWNWFSEIIGTSCKCSMSKDKIKILCLYIICIKSRFFFSLFEKPLLHFVILSSRSVIKIYCRSWIMYKWIAD